MRTPCPWAFTHSHFHSMPIPRCLLPARSRRLSGSGASHRGVSLSDSPRSTSPRPRASWSRSPSTPQSLSPCLVRFFLSVIVSKARIKLQFSRFSGAGASCHIAAPVSLPQPDHPSLVFAATHVLSAAIFVLCYCSSSRLHRTSQTPVRSLPLRRSRLPLCTFF